MTVNSILAMQLWSVSLQQWEIAGEFLPAEQWEKYDNLDSLRNLYMQALVAGHETFDWKVAHEKGWLSRHDYKIFAKELNGLTWEGRMNEYQEQRKNGVKTPE